LIENWAKKVDGSTSAIQVSLECGHGLSGKSDVPNLEDNDGGGFKPTLVGPLYRTVVKNGA